MERTLPTVAVVDDNRRGFRIINRAAFDPAVHVVYDPDAPAPPAGDPPPDKDAALPPPQEELDALVAELAEPDPEDGDTAPPPKRRKKAD